MSEPKDAACTVAMPRTLQAIAEQVAGDFIHRLAPACMAPARLVCPTDEAEQAVVDAVTQAAGARRIPVEVIDVRPAPAERLDAITARLGTSGDDPAANGRIPTLLILRGFDVFGDESHDGPRTRSDANSSLTRTSFGCSSVETHHVWTSYSAATNDRCIRRRETLRPKTGSQATSPCRRRRSWPKPLQERNFTSLLRAFSRDY